MNTQPDQVRAPKEDRRASKLATCTKCHLDFWSRGSTVCFECEWKRGQNEQFEAAFASVFAAGRRD